MLLAYLSSLIGPVQSLARLSTTVARGTASRDRLAELLRLPLLEPAAGGPPPAALPQFQAIRQPVPSPVPAAHQPAGAGAGLPRSRGKPGPPAPGTPRRTAWPASPWR